MKSYDKKLAKQLVLDELFDLTLYKRFRAFTDGPTGDVLDELIPIETKHLAVWQEFFNITVSKLNFWRTVKLEILVLFSRIFGERGVHLVLEAIEVYGIKKYLNVWEFYKDEELGKAICDVLMDEFKHEDAIVEEVSKRKIHPERIRNLFLGYNDGLVEVQIGRAHV